MRKHSSPSTVASGNFEKFMNTRSDERDYRQTNGALQSHFSRWLSSLIYWFFIKFSFFSEWREAFSRKLEAKWENIWILGPRHWLLIYVNACQWINEVTRADDSRFEWSFCFRIGHIIATHGELVLSVKNHIFRRVFTSITLTEQTDTRCDYFHSLIGPIDHKILQFHSLLRERAPVKR